MPIADVLLGLMGRFGYALIFLFGVGEALPLIGVIIPGHALLLASGVAASAGVLDIRWVILIAFVAGIVGDAISFWVARRWGQRIFDAHAHRFRIKRSHLEASNAVFDKYGAFALVVVRFSFIARGLGPTLAGMSAMKWRTFWIYNVVGAAAWAVVNGLGGYYGGLAFFAVQEKLGRILAYTLLAAIALIVLYRVMRKYAAGFTRADLAVTIMGVASVTVFGVVASRVEKLANGNALDAHARAWAHALAPGAPLFEAVEILTSPIVLGAIALVLLGAMIGRRHVWEAVFVALGVGGIMVVAPAVRGVFSFTLRDDFPAGEQLPFPPATVAIAVVFAGVVAYLAVERRKNRWVLPLAPLLVGLAALAPIATGRAYPTGSLASIALGLAWLSVAILVVEFALKRRVAATDRLTSAEA